MKKQTWLWITLLVGTLLTACGSKKEETKADEETSVSMGGAMDAMKEMAKQAEEQQKKGPVEVIDFRQLKEMLPADADGLARKEATGEKNGAMGMNISTAEAKYSNTDGSQNMEVTIVDMGGSAAMIGMAAWSIVDVDKETATGYEKTTKMGDNKAYEKYDNEGKEGEVAVLVNKRFIVTAKGNGVGMDKIKATLDAIDLDKLAGLK